MSRRRLLRVPVMLCGGYLLVCVLATLVWGRRVAGLDAVATPSAIVLGCFAVLWILAREERTAVGP